MLSDSEKRRAFKKERLITLLDQLFKIYEEIPLKEFNTQFPCKTDEQRKKLRALEKEYPELGIAKYGTSEEGFSVLSLIRTITNVLIGEELMFTVNSNTKKGKKIGKWGAYTIDSFEWYKKPKPKEKK